MLSLLRSYCILQSVLLRSSHLCPFLFVTSYIPSTWDNFSSAWRAPLSLLVWVLTGKLYFCLKISLLHYHSWNIFSLHMEFWFGGYLLSAPWRYHSTVFLASPLAAEKCLFWGWFIWRSSVFFLLAALKIFFFLSLVFYSVTAMCVGVDLFLFRLLGNC